MGGIRVPAHILNRGQEIYLGSCASCHGVLGDGRGPVGLHQKPAPRDLRQGSIKFASVPVGALPTDEDLKRIVRKGLRGTAMLVWPVSNTDVDAVIQYIKLFSQRWQQEIAGQPIVIGTDPFLQNSHEAIALGKRLYHTKAQCSSCHPTYVFSDTKVQARDGWVLRPNPQEALFTPSDYGAPIRATRFGKDVLRAGGELEDIYRAIAAGIGGTAMPSWEAGLSAKEIWALAYYVQDLNLRENQRP